MHKPHRQCRFPNSTGYQTQSSMKSYDFRHLMRIHNLHCSPPSTTTLNERIEYPRYGTARCSSDGLQQPCSENQTWSSNHNAAEYKGVYIGLSGDSGQTSRMKKRILHTGIPIYSPPERPMREPKSSVSRRLQSPE